MFSSQQPQPPSSQGQHIRQLQERESAFSCSELTNLENSLGRAQARRIEETMFEESAVVFAFLNDGVPCQVEGKTYQQIEGSSDLVSFLVELRRNLPVYQFSCKRKKLRHFRKISEQYLCRLKQQGIREDSSALRNRRIKKMISFSPSSCLKDFSSTLAAEQIVKAESHLFKTAK